MSRQGSVGVAPSFPHRLLRALNLYPPHRPSVRRFLNFPAVAHNPHPQHARHRDRHLEAPDAASAIEEAVRVYGIKEPWERERLAARRIG
jgi:hypothetical protein